jgi:D-xylose transport system substrate-binding protein
VALAEGMISEGARVLVLDSVDTGSGVRVERAADTAGVPVIDYQHMNPGGTAGYFVSFDYEDVGRLGAEAMIECLDARGITHPKIIMVDGGTDVDENAVLLAIGAHQVVDPMVSAGRAEIEETTVKGWRLTRAAPAFMQALNASDGQVDAVFAANEDIADAVIGVLGDHGLGATIVSGQGSGTDSLHNVLTGRQSASVFTDPELEAEAAARLAAALASTGTRASSRVPLSTFDDPLAPGHRLLSILLPGQVITGANVEDVVGAGASPTSEPR